MRHFNRAERESDAPTPFHCTRQFNCANAWRDSDTLNSTHFHSQENLNRYRRGIRTIRGITRASGRLLREHNRSPAIPQRLPPRRSGIVRSPDKKSGAIGLCAGEGCICFGFCGNHEKGTCKNESSGAGNENAGAAGGRQS